MRRISLFACIAAVAASVTLSAQRWGRDQIPGSGACFYEDADFKGDYFCVASGGEVAVLSEDTNDKISSIRVLGGVEVTVFSDARFNGNSTRYAGEVRDLAADGWDDKISSLRVGAPRRTMAGAMASPGADVDRIIRQAYREVLNREPDPQGMEIYRNHMLRDGWNDDKVRQSLKSSPEFAQKGGMTVEKAQEVVRRAYLSVLKREPDPASKTFVEKVMSGWSQQDVENELRKSDEYRRRR
ncbi:MAG TPA: peptidase inhibitor family I36 protein [Vicinamibacterales bacterium]|nr:peptidase inhibitor family I36 protein [Vicinamibacterales bacterium]